MRTCVRMAYVELHCHSTFSFLDGASHPIELIAAAAEQGHTALALTDHDGIYGAMELAQAAKPLGIKPITGAEITLDDRHAAESRPEPRRAPRGGPRLPVRLRERGRRGRPGGPGRVRAGGRRRAQ